MCGVDSLLRDYPDSHALDLAVDAPERRLLHCAEFVAAACEFLAPMRRSTAHFAHTVFLLDVFVFSLDLALHLFDRALLRRYADLELRDAPFTLRDVPKRARHRRRAPGRCEHRGRSQ